MKTEGNFDTFGRRVWTLGELETRVKALEDCVQNIMSIMVLFCSVKRNQTGKFEAAIMSAFQELGIPYEPPSSHGPGEEPTPTVVSPGPSTT